MTSFADRYTECPLPAWFFDRAGQDPRARFPVELWRRIDERVGAAGGCVRVVAAWYERPTELANHLGHIATSLLPACASAYLIDRFSPARGSLYRADTFSFVLEQETLSERGDVLPIEERIASALSWYLARETSSPPLAAPDAATLTEANDLAARHGPRLVVAHVEIDFAPGEGSGARLERFVREAHGFDPKPWPERLRIE